MFLYNLVTNWKWPGERPTSYGWYHIMWLVIMIVACILLCHFIGKKHDKKKDDIVIFSIGVMLVGIEIYKQVFYTIDAGHYQWYAFPFQFCSVPMYVAFIAPLLKDGKVKDAMYKFLALFGLLAGVAVMLYPGDCLSTSYITILIHTMLWHSSMVVMGVYIIYSKGYGNKYLNELIPGVCVFSIIVLVAVLANIIAYKLYFGIPELNVRDETFFLLYISPYYRCALPILADIKEAVPYPIFLFLYILAFAIGTSLIWSIVKGINKLVSLQKNKHEKANV